MNTISSLRSKMSGFLGRLLYTSLAVCGIGMLSAPGSAIAGTVTIDSAPLIVQASLPPDVVLMLDDSGSMAWDYMPDWDYLADTSADGVRDYLVNQVYYNPNVTYTPPPHADGTFYPNSPGLTNAYADGFTNSNATDVTRYRGAFNYYTRFSYQVTSTYDATLGCNSGDTLLTSGPNSGQCQNATYSWWNDSWTYSYYAPSYVCNSGDTLISGNECQTTQTQYKYFFTYTTGAPGGSYTQHYIGATGDCAVLTSKQQAVCDDSAASQQNVANWFSYYHTRILMAKTGLMNSFIGINPAFRVGFGSINNNNASGVKATGYYTTSYNGKYIAQVQPFGDGSSGTQKAYFWDWVANIHANNSTPLRSSLDAVGQYYGSSQPWSTMSSDPDPTDTNELACRQAYTILTTDGFWNGSLSGGPGNADGSNGTTVTGPNGQSYTYTAAAPYSDSYSNTLADVAMKYWGKDLRPSTNNEVPTSPEDPAFWQHMTTFTLGLGFTPTGISPSGTTVDQIFSWANGGTAIKNFSWPQPSANNIYNIADLAHAAVDGHGGFYSATSPEAFASGMKDALKRAAERQGTGASLAANSTQLQTGTVAYQANYYTAKWTGDLQAYPVNSTTGAIATSASWTAASALPAAASRNIYTYNPVAGTYLAFKLKNSTLPSLSTAQLSALGANATAQGNMINYLRGDATYAQTDPANYRKRDTPLGDIVDSQPVYVGAPDPNQFYTSTFAGSSSFAAYASSNINRAGKIYVAANDGMLHGFDATTGAETYAYLPGAVITSGLSSLASPDYGADVPHQYFNDGELTVADVYFSSSSKWHTVLVGTTGKGTAKTIYALDVTDPSSVTLLWERSASDGLSNSDYIGQMTGKPVVAQTADGSWSVLIGNGYNSAAGKAALLQFDIQSGALSVYSTSDATGLAAPAVWIGTAGTNVSTEAYAGDLDGHVWHFALNSGTYTTPSSASTTLVYTAKDASNNPQPITAGMLLGKDPTSGNLWVFFGTGKYLTASDLTDINTQSWYGLIVDSSSTTNPAVNSTMSRTSLAQRSITSETSATGNTLGARTISTLSSAASLSGKSGWYIDLLSPTGTNGADVQRGERMVTPNQFQGSLLLGTTRIPQATDPCNPSGSGWIMAIDPFTGTNPVASFFDTNGDGQINSSDDVGGTPAAGVGFTSLPNNPIFVGGTMLVSFDNGSNSSIKTSGSGANFQRVSWRELINQ